LPSAEIRAVFSLSIALLAVAQPPSSKTHANEAIALRMEPCPQDNRILLEDMRLFEPFGVCWTAALAAGRTTPFTERFMVASRGQNLRIRRPA
jgi:hypothetical protein